MNGREEGVSIYSVPLIFYCSSLLNPFCTKLFLMSKGLVKRYSTTYCHIGCSLLAMQYLFGIELNSAQLCSTLLNFAQLCSTLLNFAQLYSILRQFEAIQMTFTFPGAIRPWCGGRFDGRVTSLALAYFNRKLAGGWWCCLEADDL
jgi:hypothetical protein